MDGRSNEVEAVPPRAGSTPWGQSIVRPLMRRSTGIGSLAARNGRSDGWKARAEGSGADAQPLGGGAG
jgi:hypothetical protein